MSVTICGVNETALTQCDSLHFLKECFVFSANQQTNQIILYFVIL